MPSPSMKRMSTDRIVLEDKVGHRSEIIPAVVSDKIYVGSDKQLPIQTGNMVIHLRDDGTEIRYKIIDYEFQKVRGELFYTIEASKHSSQDPKWLNKLTSVVSSTKVLDIIQLVEKWIPKQRYKSEESYVAALAEYLVGQGVQSPEQQGMSLTDILAGYDSAIEVKLTPERSDYDRLCGQVIRQLEEYSFVIVVIIRPDKRDLLDEYKTRFDPRVTFIVK